MKNEFDRMRSRQGIAEYGYNLSGKPLNIFSQAIGISKTSNGSDFATLFFAGIL
jgi:hypothetical protein